VISQLSLLILVTAAIIFPMILKPYSSQLSRSLNRSSEENLLFFERARTRKNIALHNSIPDWSPSRDSSASAREAIVNRVIAENRYCTR
jgi:hypothetical protein